MGYIEEAKGLLLKKGFVDLKRKDFKRRVLWVMIFIYILVEFLVISATPHLICIHGCMDILQFWEIHLPSSKNQIHILIIPIRIFFNIISVIWKKMLNQN